MSNTRHCETTDGRFPRFGGGVSCRAFLLIALLSSIAAADGKPASDAGMLPKVEDHVEEMTTIDGFFTIVRDDDAGKVWLLIEDWDADFLYSSGLSSGLGSNPVGLDRGQWGKTRVVRFKRVGRRVYLIERNLRYRAVTENSAERRAVDDSFADSVIWAADVAARTGDRCLVDVSPLLVRDAHGVVNELKDANQGDFALDKDRSFIALDRCRTFPRNTELKAAVTFASKRPGPLVRETAADGDAFSLQLHHSFVKLPEPGYRPRRADPRVGTFNITFADYSAPLDAPLTQRWITRHRLQKADPKSSESRPVKPIVYYLDPGTPQPVRDALLDGARWWAEAFEEAGFVDAFQVRMLPEDVDPMDVRYNVIQWVHRSTRGWSYGQSIVDPRTGEIIKGHVLLGSLRVRHDRLIIDGLTSGQSPLGGGVCRCCGIAGTGTDQAFALFDDAINPLDVSLARLRQLSAHEVGHTLGFSHNFAASTYGDRASVMDYPAPRVKVTEDGKLDLTDAYGVGVGDWDRFLVRYAYTTFTDKQTETAELARLVEDARDRGMTFLSDADARPGGAAHPLANLWDNGNDPIAELRHVMKVRKLALDRLEAGDLVPGGPLADLELVLVPIYLYHRYQVAATVKLIGGFNYRYAVSAETEAAVQPVPIDRQQAALDALLGTLDVEALLIPERLLRLLPPKPFSDVQDRERFPTRTSMVFDPSAAVRIAAEQTLSQVLHPQRTARLAAYPQADWGLRSVLDRIVAGVLKRPIAEDVRSQEVQRIVQRALVRNLIALAEDSSTSAGVQAASEAVLRQIAEDVRSNRANLPGLGADHTAAILGQIERFLNRPHTPARSPDSIPAPPGSPIGDRF